MKRLFLLVLLVIGLVVPCLAFADIMDVVADTAWNLSGGALLFGSLGDAPPFLETLTFFDRCWFCEPIDIVFDVINQVVTETCSTMQPVSLAFLGALFLFWLLVRVGKGVVDVTPSEDSRLVYDLLKQTMRVIVATTLLVGWGTVFSHIVDPALEVAIGMGNTISLNRMSGEQSIGFRSSPGSSSSTATATLCPEYDNLLKQAKNSSSFGQQNDSETNPQEGGQAYSPVVKEAFICYIRVGCASFNRGLALGASAIQAWSHQNIISKVRYFELFLIGLFIFVGYLLLLLGLPTKLLDPLITLAFVSALLPVWIVLWTFEQTKKYATNALNLFIGVLVHLIVISIVTVLVIEIMNCALGDKDTQRELFQRLLNGEDTYEVFTTTLGLGYYSFVLLVALMWLSGKLFDKTTTLAGQFEKVVDFGIGSGAAQNISAVVSKVKGAGAEGIAAVGHGTTLGAQKVKSWASRHFNSNNNSGDGSGSGGGGEGGGNPAPSSGNPPSPPPTPNPSGDQESPPTPNPSGDSGNPPPTPNPSDPGPQNDSNNHTASDANGEWSWNSESKKSRYQDRRTNITEQYDHNNQTYQESDPSSRSQNEYDRANGKATFQNKKYSFAFNAENGNLTIEFDGEKYTVDVSGVVRNAATGVLADSRIAEELRNVADFRQHAEQRMAAHEAILQR